MDNKEILIVLHKMLGEWETSFIGEIITNCGAGFCFWMYQPENLGSYTYQAMSELRIDKQNNLLNHWYETYFQTRDKNSFMPRIEHLKRTIARLENELKQ